MKKRWFRVLITCGCAVSIFTLGALAGAGIGSLGERQGEQAEAQEVDGIGVPGILPGAEVVRTCSFLACGHECRLETGDLTGLTRQEVSSLYPGDEVVEFSSSSVELKRLEQGYCPEHFVLQLLGGKLVVTRNGADLSQAVLAEIVPESLQGFLADREELEAGMPFDSMEQINAYFENAES